VNAVPADVIQILANRGVHDFVLRPKRKFHMIMIIDGNKVYEKEFDSNK
jgi:hypothetical protein